MAHPPMFEEDDPVLHRVRDLALALPGSREKVSHGRPAFYTTKVFAYYGGSLQVEGSWVQHPQAVMFLPDDDADEARALRQDPRIWIPAYLGPSGWLGLDLGLGTGETDWTEINELITGSYLRTAPRTLAARLTGP